MCPTAIAVRIACADVAVRPRTPVDQQRPPRVGVQATCQVEERGPLVVRVGVVHQDDRHRVVPDMSPLEQPARVRHVLLATDPEVTAEGPLQLGLDPVQLRGVHVDRQQQRAAGRDGDSARFEAR